MQADHGDLALLARNSAAQMRPLLLRVHVQTFVSAPRRDAGDLARFEAIATGLIPLVTDDVLAEVATLLQAVPQTPQAVTDLLAARLFVARPRSDWRAEDDAASASHPDGGDVVLEDAALDRLVEEAVQDRTLARALLARPEPGIFDRAVLYRHADERGRARIRADLEQALVPFHLPRPIGAAEATREVLRVAAEGEAALRDFLAVWFDMPPAPFEPRDQAGQEMLLFALLAIGLDPADCVRALLRLGSPLSRSVRSVFRLSEIARETPRAVAAFLSGYRRPLPALRSPDARAPRRAAGALRADGRAEATGAGSPHPYRTGREPVRTARSDHRP